MQVRTKIIAIAGLVILTSTTACQKWVDDAPQPLQVDESKIFSSEKGFREALNGVYLQMGSTSLYGKNLTMGVLSLMGRSYDSVNVKKVSDLQYKVATYDLQSASVMAYSADVWSKMYQSIANLNNVLANADSRKSVFTGNNYNTIKGEALALRAWLHFDLLRLFAPAPSTGALGNPGIPYVTAISVNPTPVSSVEQTLNHCIADLTIADELLSEDDNTNSQVTKWAVKGLLARIYLYKGDKSKANEYALAVINSGKFALSTSNADLFMIKECLFKLYIYNNNYIAAYRSLFGEPSYLGLSASGQAALYVSGNGNASDYRKSFSTSDGSVAGGLMPRKLYSNGANAFPMIHLTEMYYIAAECAEDVTTALSYLNLVRVARGLSDLTEINVPDEATLSAEIMKEYQKEFIGEGQMFFYYKRKDIPFTALPFYPKDLSNPVPGEVPVAIHASYTFVKPE